MSLILNLAAKLHNTVKATPLNFCMRCLFICLAVLSSTYASPFRFEPRVSLPPDTVEESAEVCKKGIQQIFGAVAVADVVTAFTCYTSEHTTAQAVSDYFTSNLEVLGYSKASARTDGARIYTSKKPSTIFLN